MSSLHTIYTLCICLTISTFRVFERAPQTWETSVTLVDVVHDPCDKFGDVLTVAMRRNGIDRRRRTKAMRYFGVDTVNGQDFFAFSDRGGDRSERI